MTLSCEAKANLITAAIAEDRTEIRLIRDRIYSTTTFTTVGSFGITAFLLEKAAIRIPLAFQFNLLVTCIDGALLLLLWTLCYRMLTDMMLGQLWLETREKLLDALVSDEHLSANTRIYGIEPTGTPGINHSGTYYRTMFVSTAAIALKLVALWKLNS